MERLTTDNPRNNTEMALNLVYVKDGQAWVRNGGPCPGYPDVTLYDYMRLIIADHGPMSIKTGITDDELGDALCDALFDGIETKEGLCAMLYTLAWAFAELRQRLAAYEDTGLEPADVAKFWTAFCEARAIAQALGQEYADRADTLLEADAEGRIAVLPCEVGDTVWVIDRDENGVPCDFSGYVFISAVHDFAIVSPTINGSGEVDEILQDQFDMFLEDCSCDFIVIPLADCCFSRDEAEKAVEGEVGSDG